MCARLLDALADIRGVLTSRRQFLKLLISAPTSLLLPWPARRASAGLAALAVSVAADRPANSPLSPHPISRSALRRGGVEPSWVLILWEDSLLLPFSSSQLVRHHAALPLSDFTFRAPQSPSLVLADSEATLTQRG
jgi:hypothetical protein